MRPEIGSDIPFYEIERLRRNAHALYAELHHLVEHEREHMHVLVPVDRIGREPVRREPLAYACELRRKFAPDLGTQLRAACGGGKKVLHPQTDDGKAEHAALIRDKR